ncbi:hypothetical protein GWP85_12380 [Acinetobacter beijerinckii]|uniref:hypothetical protein n=1 Tax=Acinetobacter beijerinckii TaxID=262668 RepID=UPI0023DD66D0|nr:hypothetical protein [Acinetobacter beijerinckii]MDF2418294.1 hypothetical protein [Acinetobacter beijerinckii]
MPMPIFAACTDVLLQQLYIDSYRLIACYYRQSIDCEKSLFVESILVSISVACSIQIF